MEKIKVKEAIVVEGRDDTAAVLCAVEGITIETHGFGIKKETWELINEAYNNRGIIVFTDPDFSGEEIRKKIMERFPSSKEAFLSKEAATKDGDIGIENAKPEAIIEALNKAHFTNNEEKARFSILDLDENNLSYGEGAKERREKLGKLLGIGYGNCKTLVNKLNKFGITREEFLKHLKEI